MKKVTVDESLCIGCGLCAASHADMFEINDEGKAVCIAEGEDADAEDAIASCPVGAIA